MTQRTGSLVNILRWRAKYLPQNLAYRFLADGEHEEFLLNYNQLDLQARSIAALLQSVARPGERALLLFPPGLDFIAAYFGCLYAGIISIPAYPPHPARMEKTLPSLSAIAEDAQPTVALLTPSLHGVIHERPEIQTAFSGIKLLAIDTEKLDVIADQWQPPEIQESDIAFLQYTSGSTSTPKGVMVSHGNLMHNLGLLEKSFGPAPDTHSVIWLPPYHDMGLIGGILQPVYSGYPATLIPYLLFLQRPLRWLQAISRFRATLSVAPNFAYDLCVKKIKPEQKAQLDLSHWSVAFNGAEPVSHKTIEAFSACFAECGFRREAFLPCYGLAEATLIVSGGPAGREPIIRHFQSSALEQDRAIFSENQTEDTRTLVGCGQNLSDQQIRVVNLETLSSCLPDEVGEIWVRGPSVTLGYWNKPDDTKYTFDARLAPTGEGPFLRTGDLGFMHEEELFIAGRLKNLIIIDGNNHYANDIEQTVENAHPAIRSGGSAAFSIQEEEGELLVIIVEMERQADVPFAEVMNAIRQAVSLHHDLHVHDIKLTPIGGIPRTHSGKKRHYLCKKNYLEGNIKEIYSI